MPTHSLRSDQYTQTAAAAAMTRPEAAWQWPRALSALGLLKGPWAWEHALLGLSGRDRHAFEAALLSAVSASKATAATATSKQPGSAGPAWRRVMAFFHSLPGLSLRRSCVSFANVAGLRLKWSQSLHIAERMGQVGIPSSIVVQSSVMDSVGAESSRWRLALSIFHRLSRGVQADVVAFCVMSTSFGDASEWGKSLLLHDEQMRQLVTFRTSLTACERGSQWQCGLRLLDASQAAGFHDANSAQAALKLQEIKLSLIFLPEVVVSFNEAAAPQSVPVRTVGSGRSPWSCFTRCCGRNSDLTASPSAQPFLRVLILATGSWR